MLHISVSYRALAIVALLFAVAFASADIAHSTPAAADLTLDGNLVFTGPNQGGAKDIRTSNTDGGLRIYNGSDLNPIPTGAAIQFFGNGSTSYPGQAYIDSGANNNAALIFRTAGTGQGITERMRITSTGNVGLGTNDPQEQLELTGNLRLPLTTATTGIIRSGTNTLIHTFGSNNFFAGVDSGNLTTTGNSNTATGRSSLRGNTSGSGNTALGRSALQANTTGGNNTATGQFALKATTTGSANTATGGNALESNTTGDNNTASGSSALLSNTGGVGNTATGREALRTNSVGTNNTATGLSALQLNTTGNSNTATGRDAMLSNTTSNNNTAMGGAALSGNTTGSNNAALGQSAGGTNITGSSNTFVGFLADASTSALTNATAIGANATVGASNSLVLGGTGGNAVSVGIGTTTPLSTFQVVGNYIQYPTVTGSAPLAADCDEATEAGRTVVRTDGVINFYVCTGGGGWLGK